MIFRFLDHQVIDFLNKIKPVFTNVFLDIHAIKFATAMRSLFAHLIPMLASIRGIECNHTGLEVLEQQFPGTLAMARELDLHIAKRAFIPTYLSWLNAPVHGPRFLKISAGSKAIFAIVDAVHKVWVYIFQAKSKHFQQFMAATVQSTFVIFLEFFNFIDRDERAKEFTVQNPATNEQLSIRNAHFNKPFVQFGGHGQINYVEVLRHPIGADANMREWVKQRAYYDYKYDYQVRDKAEQVISLTGPSLIIG